MSECHPIVDYHVGTTPSHDYGTIIDPEVAFQSILSSAGEGSLREAGVGADDDDLTQTASSTPLQVTALLLQGVREGDPSGGAGVLLKETTTPVPMLGHYHHHHHHQEHEQNKKIRKDQGEAKEQALLKQKPHYQEKEQGGGVGVGEMLGRLCRVFADSPQVLERVIALAEDNLNLHKACQLFPKNSSIIETALLFDPTAVTRPASIPARSCTAKRMSLPSTFDTAGWFGRFRDPSKKKKKIRKDYRYPINIALHNGASPAVVRLLANQAPEVLLIKDGSQGHCSLMIALLHHHHHHHKQGGGTGGSSSTSGHILLEEIIDAILESNLLSIAVMDRMQNTPLHIACQRIGGSSSGGGGGCGGGNHIISLKVVQKLLHADWGAFHQRNLHGKTPLDIAQTNTSCREDVLDYLMRVQDTTSNEQQNRRATSTKK